MLSVLFLALTATSALGTTFCNSPYQNYGELPQFPSTFLPFSACPLSAALDFLPCPPPSPPIPPLTAGICMDKGACGSAGGYSTPDYCPGGASNQCCRKGNCRRVVTGKCPGDANHVWVPSFNQCKDTIPGRCPGGSDYRWVAF